MRKRKARGERNVAKNKRVVCRKPIASGLSRSKHYQTPHLLLRSPKQTLAQSIAVFEINSIALLHSQ